MTIFDQTGDLNGQVTYSILKLTNPPEFVKNASSTDVRGSDEVMALSAYAEPMTKQFPVHTKAATWMSMAFLLQNESKMQPSLVKSVSDFIEKAAKFHGIIDDIDNLVEEWETCKEAGFNLTDDDFAVVIKNDDGTFDRHYPLRNAKEVQAAASYLEQWIDKIPYDTRVDMANKILDKADLFGAFIPNNEFVEKQAGRGGCSAEMAANMIWDRVMRIGSMSNPDEFQIELAKMAKACMDHPEQLNDEDALVKLASIINTVDQIYNIKYTQSVKRPEDVLFSFTKTAASKYLADHVKVTSGCVYKVADFANVDLEDIRSIMGNEFAEEVSDGGLFVSPTKLAEQAAALPRPDAELLDRLFLDVGIKPTSKEAASNYKLTSDDLKQLAALRVV